MTRKKLNESECFFVGWIEQANQAERLKESTTLDVEEGEVGSGREVQKQIKRVTRRRGRGLRRKGRERGDYKDGQPRRQTRGSHVLLLLLPLLLVGNWTRHCGWASESEWGRGKRREYETRLKAHCDAAVGDSRLPCPRREAAR